MAWRTAEQSAEKFAPCLQLANRTWAEPGECSNTPSSLCSAPTIQSHTTLEKNPEHKSSCLSCSPTPLRLKPLGEALLVRSTVLRSEHAGINNPSFQAADTAWCTGREAGGWKKDATEAEWGGCHGDGLSEWQVGLFQLPCSISFFVFSSRYLQGTKFFIGAKKYSPKPLVTESAVYALSQRALFERPGLKLMGKYKVFSSGASVFQWGINLFYWLAFECCQADEGESVKKRG